MILLPVPPGPEHFQPYGGRIPLLRPADVGCGRPSLPPSFRDGGVHLLHRYKDAHATPSTPNPPTPPHRLPLAHPLPDHHPIIHQHLEDGLPLDGGEDHLLNDDVGVRPGDLLRGGEVEGAEAGDLSGVSYGEGDVFFLLVRGGGGGGGVGVGEGLECVFGCVCFFGCGERRDGQVDRRCGRDVSKNSRVGGITRNTRIRNTSGTTDRHTQTHTRT